MFEVLDSSGWSFALLAVAATCAHFLAEPVRWWLMLGGRAEFRRMFYVFSLTALLSYALPFKMGLPARQVLLRRTLNERHGLLAAVLGVDTLFYYLVWAVSAVGLGALLLSRGIAPDVALSDLVAIAVALALIAGMVAVLARRRLVGLTDRVSDAHRQGLLSSRNQALQYLAVLGLDVAAHGVRHWAILRAIGVDLGFAESAAIGVVALFIGMASFLPLGLGAYDGAVVGLLALASDNADGLLFVPLINRALSVSVALVLGVFGGFRLGIDRKQLARLEVHPDDL